jgi:hypothetical protein
MCGAGPGPPGPLRRCTRPPALAGALSDIVNAYALEMANGVAPVRLRPHPVKFVLDFDL